MARPAAPVWLSRPSRFATLSVRRARIGLTLLAALLLAALAAANPPEGAAAIDPVDIVLHETVVDGMRHGESYYPLAAAVLRQAGLALHPLATFRMPALAMIQAALPPMATTALLYLLAATVALAWYGRIAEALSGRLARALSLMLLAGGMAALVQPGLAAVHEAWAGLLIALSLALWRPERWVEPVAIALLAMLIRESAALYAGVMAGFALAEGRRREALAWAAAIALFGLAFLSHAGTVAELTPPLAGGVSGTPGAAGPGAIVRAVSASTVLALLPPWLASLTAAFALFGWTAWGRPAATRALASFCCYAALIALSGGPDGYRSGLLIAPVLLVGLAFAPDGLRDLALRALDTRRVRVQRITR